MICSTHSASDVIRKNAGKSLYVFLLNVAVIGVFSEGCENRLFENFHCTYRTPSHMTNCDELGGERCRQTANCHLEQPTDCDAGEDSDGGVISAPIDAGDSDGGSDGSCAEVCVGEIVKCSRVFDEKECLHYSHCAWVSESI